MARTPNSETDGRPLEATGGLSVLVVDDNPAVVRSLSRLCKKLGYTVESADTGQAALALLRTRPPGLMLLDRGLPDMDGIQVVVQMREWGMTTPVIVVSGIEESAERAKALRLGADDYMVKPIDPEELKERMLAVMRRCGPAQAIGRGDEIRVAPALRALLIAGREYRLSEIHFAMVRILYEANGEPVSREDLLRYVWKLPADAPTNCVAMEISRLREALGPDADRVECVRGSGYALNRRKRGVV